VLAVELGDPQGIETGKSIPLAAGWFLDIAACRKVGNSDALGAPRVAKPPVPLCMKTFAIVTASDRAYGDFLIEHWPD
jgi:hypothetical protein